MTPLALQRFKENDETERKIIACLMPTLEELSAERDLFFTEAYESFGLGEVLFDLGRDPMVLAVPRDIFLRSYPAIHEWFTGPGTFEFYLKVFRAIFGPDVEVSFTVPDNGVLQISANVLNLTTQTIDARIITSNQYAYYSLKTSDTDEFILSQVTVGLQTENQIDALIFELSVQGVHTTCTLTF